MYLIWCVISTLQTVSPYWECGWGTEHPDLSWGTPDHVSSGRHIRTPPPPGRGSCETHQPRTVDGRENIINEIYKND